MNKEQATALCRLLAQEQVDAPAGGPVEQLESEALYHDLLTIDLFSEETGNCAFCTFAVVPNENPNAKPGQEPTFAVLQYEPDSGDSWIHVSEDVCFFATAFQTEGR